MKIFGSDDIQLQILATLERNYDTDYFNKLIKGNNFFDYYKKMSKNDKDNVIFLICLRKKFPEIILKTEMNDFVLKSQQKLKEQNQNYKITAIEHENLEFFKGIEDWQNNLVNKIDSNNLSESEYVFIINLLSNCILNNIEIDILLLEKLVEKYILKNPMITVDELLILLFYTINMINNKFSSNYNIHFTSNISAFAQTDFSNDPNTILINETFYRSLMQMEQISKDDFLELFCYQNFALLHEVKHLQQFFYIKSHNDDYAKKLNQEIKVINYDNEFYQENHSLFFIEEDANEFGFNELEKFCYDFLSLEYILKFIRLAKERLSNGNLSKSEFQVEFNRICNEIDSFDFKEQKKFSI